MQIEKVSDSLLQNTPQELCRQLLHMLSSSVTWLCSDFDIEKMLFLVEVVSQCPGAIFCTGVGKSGIIAQKMAMTLSSCGFRSFYLAAQNALHGDIGAVTDGDIVFMLSKSGETDELLALLPAFREKNVKTVSVVSATHSRLSAGTTYTFVLPPLKELCPYDIAPTTSALAQMVFGDILAMLLMRLQSIRLDQFVQNHPAGRIGRRHLLRVCDLMISGEKMPTCGLKDILKDVLVELSNKQCGAVCVLGEKNMLLGIFTDGDLRRALQRYGSESLKIPMDQLMIQHPKIIAPGVLAVEALHAMEENPKRLITILPVVENGICVGVLRMHDLLQAGI